MSWMQSQCFYLEHAIGCCGCDAGAVDLRCHCADPGHFAGVEAGWVAPLMVLGYCGRCSRCGVPYTGAVASSWVRALEGAMAVQPAACSVTRLGVLARNSN
jgi:hypothetical protein